MVVGDGFSESDLIQIMSVLLHYCLIKSKACKWDIELATYCCLCQPNYSAGPVAMRNVVQCNAACSRCKNPRLFSNYKEKILCID